MLARGPVYLWSDIDLTDIIPGPFRYHILGSTLSPAWLTASITHHYLNLFPILERTEAYSYLCCPTAILRLILAPSQLSVSILGTADAADRAAATASAVDLLYQALDFDIWVWTCNVQSVSPSADLQSREHIASAHRSATCLYILQALPPIRAASPDNSDELVNNIVTHLAFISEHNPHFKATAWPSFVAGAETRDSAQREWLLQRLLAVWGVCPWGYIFTAVEMRRKTWALRDARTVAEEDFGRVSGFRELWAMHLDCLVV
jgi:hypothetical protein